ncbi:MAG: acetate kinase [Coriobacteriia bacterium]|nr:acetate kinase [Coriobacteriia bacterium]MCL2537583.1 acetate kinase [Coriobacteriia bacterium]
MKILVLNAGSSSLKYQLMDSTTEEVLAKGLFDRIGMSGKAEHSWSLGGKKHSAKLEIENHEQALEAAVKVLSADGGVISSFDDISAVGHRVVHGGEYFSTSVAIDEDVLEKLDEVSPLAPLHNPAAVSCIRAARSLMPEITHVAAFDTAYHQTIPPKAHHYPLPQELYDKYKVRRYGFHGNSHRYVAQRVSDLVNIPLRDLKIISCHLGNGASIAAIKNGVSVDTSMGFTPLEGLMMGTRTGSIDPAIVTFLMRQENLSPDEIDNLMNKKSGLLGVTGISSDLRDVLDAQEAGNELAKLAREMYAYSIKRYIGQYMAVLGGLDIIVMTAGVGENSPVMRAAALAGLEHWGIAVDPWRNIEKSEVFKDGLEGEYKISASGSRVKVLVVPTNEELMIARDTKALL